MLKHMLMDPAFPDLVADWATSDEEQSAAGGCANDNREPVVTDQLDPLTALGKVEIAATRLW
jgi:hypothetical protein